jgi:hypothetical protein
MTSSMTAWPFYKKAGVNAFFSGWDKFISFSDVKAVLCTMTRSPEPAASDNKPLQPLCFWISVPRVDSSGWSNSCICSLTDSEPEK